ncbi:MAG: hypothetical protein ACXVB4_18650 [Pseudobdellovibrionaceae bacterium]
MLVLSVNMLVSCVAKEESLTARPLSGAPNSPKGPTLGSPHEKAQGASDSIDGAGIDGKAFESYIIDPTKLPAYVNIVKPLLENILPTDPSKPTKYDEFFVIKTWYLAPADVDKIQKNTLGVSFLKSETQQIARQSMKEVLIDKRIFDKMNEKDQAEILVYEFIMDQYLLRFANMKSLCQVSLLVSEEKAKENEGCSNIPDFVERTMPAEKPRVLKEEDNENVRYVTAWFLKNAKSSIPEQDYIKVLLYKGFDKRFFNQMMKLKE